MCEHYHLSHLLYIIVLYITVSLNFLLSFAKNSACYHLLLNFYFQPRVQGINFFFLDFIILSIIPPRPSHSFLCTSSPFSTPFISLPRIKRVGNQDLVSKVLIKSNRISIVYLNVKISPWNQTVLFRVLKIYQMRPEFFLS